MPAREKPSGHFPFSHTHQSLIGVCHESWYRRIGVDADPVNRIRCDFGCACGTSDARMCPSAQNRNVCPTMVQLWGHVLLSHQSHFGASSLSDARKTDEQMAHATALCILHPTHPQTDVTPGEIRDLRDHPTKQCNFRTPEQPPPATVCQCQMDVDPVPRRPQVRARIANACDSCKARKGSL